MTINKRICRQYADPGLSISPGSGLLCMDSVRYIVRTAVKNIAGQRLLLLYFYSREQAAEGRYVPVYTLFQAKNDYITWEQPADGGGKWRTSSLERMEDYSHPILESCGFYAPKDEARITRFCAVSDAAGLEALWRMQNNILAARTKQRIQARERKTIEQMKIVPSAPRDLKGFIHREVLPAYVVYTYHKGKKTMAGYCTACRHDVLVTGARHNQAGICPRCRRNITFKAAGRVRSLYDRATVQIIQYISSEELLVRIFKAAHDYKGDYRSEKVRVWENARFFVRRKRGDVDVTPYYYAYSGGGLTQWKPGYRPYFNHWTENFEADTCGYVYHRNLEAALKGTAWEYSQLKPFYLKLHEPMEVIPYLQSYLRYSMIEYLVKLGLIRIVTYVVYSRINEQWIHPDGKNPREVLGVSPQDIPLLQAVNANIQQLALLRELRERNIRANVPLLIWCENIAEYQRKDLLFALQFTTPMKLIRYIDAQYEKMKDEIVPIGVRRYENKFRVLSEYNDYLRVAVKLEYDLKSSFVLFPRNLNKAHDLAASLYWQNESEINDRVIGAAYAELLKRYGFAKNGLTVLPPKTAREIVSEGHALHHCVGTYVSKVVNGESIILFLRKMEDPDTSFYTMELRDGKLAQIRGQNNAAPTPDVNQYITLYKRKILQKAQLANTPKAA